MEGLGWGHGGQEVPEGWWRRRRAIGLCLLRGISYEGRGLLGDLHESVWEMHSTEGIKQG